MKKEVNLCDDCEEAVSSERCSICNVDLCKSCVRHIPFVFHTELRSVYYCPHHFKDVANIPSIHNDEKWDEIVEIINEHLKKKLIIKNL